MGSRDKAGGQEMTIPVVLEIKAEVEIPDKKAKFSRVGSPR